MVCKNCGSATPDGYESVLTKGNKLEPEITSFRIEEKHQKKGINVKTVNVNEKVSPQCY